MRLIFIFFIIFFCGCKPGDRPSVLDIEPTINQPAGTKKMIARLADFSNQKDLSIRYYFNKSRAEAIKARLDINAPDYVDQSFSYAMELLNSGDSEQAALEAERLINLLEQNGYTLKENMMHFYEFLGVSYLRIGEQQNCFNNHTPQSCVIPIKGGGLHKEPSGSEKAIQVYLKILEHFPDDATSIWLLNLAYMTLGQYPDQVPSDFLIPPENFQSDHPMPEFINIANATGTGAWGLSGGCIVEDFNNDGFLDIIASSWGVNPSDQILYYENSGDGTFTDKTASAGLSGLIGGLNLVHADYDNDGWVDVLVLRGAWIQSASDLPNSLLKNMGDGTFSDVTEEAGLLSYHPTQTAAWADFNLDGWVDLFIGNETINTNTHPSELFLNNGDGTFSEMAQNAGLTIQGYTKGVTWGDINNDKYPDLYISFYNLPNKLFLNKGQTQDGGWHFEDITETAGVSEPVTSFPVWFWDYDQDGLEDLFVSAYDAPEGPFASYVLKDMLGEKHGHGAPRLYKNNGNNTFTNLTKEVGLAVPLYTMGCNFGDLDNDGFPDMLLGTGEPDFRSVIPNLAFRNDKGKFFQDVTTATGMGNIQKGHAVGFGDFDNDGDQDIYMVLGGAYEGDVFENAFYLNPVNGTKNWITVILEGVKSNRSAIGARLRIDAKMKNGDVRSFYHTVSGGGSFGGSSLQLEMGLDNAESILNLKVTWPHPDSPDQSFQNINPNQVIAIKEGKEKIELIKTEKINLSTDPKNASHHHH